MLLLPLTGAVLVLFVSVFAGRSGPPATLEVVGMWATVYAFVGIYWVLLWRGLVRWTPQRRRKTYLTAPLALFAGALVGACLRYLLRLPLEVVVLVGGGVIPITWVLATVLVWRETPQERVQRLTASGTDFICCPVCGYNMTGLREARCPECGSRFTLDQLLTAQPHRDQVVPPRE